jgi:aminoglycoside phosphotransferase (APT) family kinase protein
MVDLGYLLCYWFTPQDPEHGGDAKTTSLAGFLSQAEMAGHYAEQLKVDVKTVDYYRAFAHWRLACIAEGIYAR